MTEEDFAKLKAGAAKILAAKADIDQVIAEFKAKLVEKISLFEAVCDSETTITINNGFQQRVTEQDVDQAIEMVTPRVRALTHTLLLAAPKQGSVDR